MKVPNWKHHSKKEQKRTLKPQALRQAKARRKALKRKLKSAFLILNKIPIHFSMTLEDGCYSLKLECALRELGFVDVGWK